MIRYKKDIVDLLTKAGYTCARMRKEKILSQSTLQRLRHGEPVNMEAINIICVILRCQPGDLLEVNPTDAEKIKFF